MQSIAALLLKRAEQTPEEAALHARMGGVYITLSWSDIARDVRRTFLALGRRGVRRGDHVALLSENRYEWLLCDLAIQCAGAVHVPLHASLTGPQIAFQLRHSASSMLILSGDEQAGKLSRCVDLLPAELTCCSIDACASLPDGPSIGSLGDYRPTEITAAQARRLDALAVAAVSPDSIATILYTSGTTGTPRGVVLTHGNLQFNATSMVRSSRQWKSDVKLNFLPLSHIYARTSDFYTWIVCGNQLALAESRQMVLDDCRAVRPTWINAVPYFYDRVRRQLQERELGGEQIDLRDVFGDRIRILHSGGAPVSAETADFYQSRGLTLYEGYGLTESSPVISTSCPGQSKRGSVGKPLEGIEVRIAEDGEILTRGPHVMAGYWQDEPATRAAIRDGWLHTGDTGSLDAEGFLMVTGRKKEMIVTTGGKSIAPVAIEMRLAADPLVHQVIVIGDRRDYLTALIVPDRDAVFAHLGRSAHDDEPADDSLSSRRVIELFERRIARRLSDLSRYEQIRKFRLLDRPFTVEEGELTLKRSLRRNVIATRYAAEIQSLY